MNKCKSLKLHFFTIVLNGYPFIDKHVKTFVNLNIDWHWHIIEGVAELKHDTGWSIQNGGVVEQAFHKNGLSIDGTTEYLDSIKNKFSSNITIYRKSFGEFWDGKREMVNAPLKNIDEECILWQIDVDEFWTTNQILKAHELFVANPTILAAYYWCHYFVGPDIVIATRNCYANNPAQEWLRTWRFKPNNFWLKHEPPILAKKTYSGNVLVAHENRVFSHEQTERLGLIFQHFAYCTEAQLQFKEKYYGYKDALGNWKRLQEEKRFPQLLRNYFPWVSDSSLVEKAEYFDIEPMIKFDNSELS